MKTSLLIILLAVLTSCCPCRHLATSTRDSVRVETNVKTEYIHDTTWIKVPVEVVRQTVIVDTSHLETSFAVSDARINEDGSLSHSLENKPQDKPIPFEKPITTVNNDTYHGKTDTKIVEVERKLTWWQQTKMRGFWVLLAVLAFVFRKNIVALARRFI